MRRIAQWQAQGVDVDQAMLALSTYVGHAEVGNTYWYVGALYPVMDVEAQELGTALFGTYIGHEMPRALWLAQKQLYGEQGRRPYAMVGLPFTAIRPNKTDAMKFVIEAYRLGVAQCKRLAENSPHDDVRANAKRYEQFLRDDFEVFQRSIQKRARPPT